jgi:hypothetical protein
MDEIKTVYRTRFADGMLLTAADLDQEQTYVERRLRYLSLFLGSGVLAGFDVKAGEGNSIVVGPGRAIDPLGREIVLDQAKDLEGREGLLCVQRDAPLEQTASDLAPTQPPPPEKHVVIRETERAKVEIVDQGTTQPPSPEKHVVIRVTERAKVEIVDQGTALETRVPVAFIRNDGGRSWRIFPAPRLGCVSHRAAVPTGIEKISWTHGDVYHGWREPWSVVFAAPVSLSPEVIEIRCAGRNNVVIGVDDVAMSDDDAKLTFAAKVRSREQPDGGDTIVLRLACDFIIDRRGVPVSGAHLAGRLPSGNGVPGGTFESWFRVPE